MRQFITLAILLVFVGFIAGCASESTDPATMFKSESEAQLFHHAENAMLDGHYHDAVQHYETLDARYPFGKYTKQAQLDVVYSYYKDDDTSSALAAADRYIHLYPRGQQVDYAYYMRGLMEYEQNQGPLAKRVGVDYANRDLSGMKKAYGDFDSLVRYFPKSLYATDAKQRMVDIRNTLARHELHVAQYYFDQKAYVAAANRANEIVRHYQQTPSVPDALAMMVKSYRALHLDRKANNTLKVLQLNFPNSKLTKSLSA